jgi:hypothetical protein
VSASGILVFALAVVGVSLSFGAESVVFQVAFQKLKDQDI